MALPMNTISPGPGFPMEAGGAISKYDLVKLHSAEGAVVKTAGDNEEGMAFVHTDSAASGEAVTCYRSGIVWARAAAAITLGDELMSAADGEVKVRAAVAGTVYNVVGRALGAAAGADELVPVAIEFYTVNTAVS